MQILLVLLAFYFWVPYAQADFVLRDVTLFDGTGAAPIHGDIEVQGTRITRVTPRDTAGSAGFVMPGLIDAHTHMLRAGSCGRDEGIGWANLAQIPRNFDVALAHGNTTVVDLGGPLYGVVAVRERMRRDGYAEPRYLVAGGLITAPHGYPFDWAPREIAEKMAVAFEAGTPEQGRAAVARLAAAGVDVIKIAVMELSYNEHPLPALDVPTITAIVDEAHRRHLRVFAHAHSNEGYRRALAGGVDVLAHSTFEALPEELVAEVARRGVVVIPTLWVFDSFDVADAHPELLAELEPQLQPPLFAALADFHARATGREDLPDDFLPGLHRSRLRFAMGNARDNLRRLKAAGVRIAFGTDTSFCYALHGAAVHELQEMVTAGLTPAEALAAATSGSAFALGRQDVGVLRPGAQADLLVLNGNPLEAWTYLQQPAQVILGGKVVHSEAHPVAEQSGVFRTLGLVMTLMQAIYGQSHW